jgi:hypothetical protein
MAIDQADIEDEVLAGLPGERNRIQDAWEAREFAAANFEQFPTKCKDGRWKSGSTRRTSRVMGRIADILCGPLYKAQPTRKLRSPVATQWLSEVYKYNGAGPKWRRADKLTLIGGFAAWQYRGTEDPEKPLRIQLWGADEIAHWCDPDEPTELMAVATLDVWNNRRRLRLYSKEQIVTYLAPEGANRPAADATGYKEIDRRDNPYRDPDGGGILPFSFAHWEFPTERFATNSPGPGLRQLNEHINERLDRLGDAIFYLGRPVLVGTNIDPSYVFPVEIKPGDALIIPSDSDAGGNGEPASLSFLQADLGFVAADWTDLNFMLDHTLEMNGVPPVIMRMVQSSARSGESLKAEQMPLLSWCEGRRGDWAHYEDEGARKAIEVTSGHLRANGLDRQADELWAVLDDWDFVLRWPQLWVELPGPEKDRADQIRLDMGYASKITIIRERMDLSDQEAIEYLVKIKEENELLEGLGIEPRSPTAAQFQQQLAAPQFGGDDGGGQDEQDADTGDS